MSRTIALLGNMNNSLFNLCRYLRDKGYDAYLYIFPFDSQHFMPAADAYDDSYVEYVKHLSWGNPYELGAVSAEEIRRELSGYDFIIGCGTAPAYLAKAGMKLDLFTPYGSDLYHFPFFKSFHPQRFFNYFLSLARQTRKVQASSAKPANWKGYIPFVLKQRQGIRESANCAIFSSGEDMYSASLKKLGFRNRYFNFTVPCIYAAQYENKTISRYYHTSEWSDKFRTIRDQSDFLIFANCRHCWKFEPDPVSFKGNDRLFRGFSEFIKKFKGRASIITFEYGTDFMESKKLCDELGVSSHVHWFPLLERKHLMIGMSLADIVIGNLGDASWSTYGVVYESMTSAKPIMQHRDDHLYAKETLFPMINAYTSEMVAENLLRYSSDKAALERIGQGAHEWFIRESIDIPVNTIVNLIENKKK